MHSWISKCFLLKVTIVLVQAIQAHSEELCVEVNQSLTVDYTCSLSEPKRGVYCVSQNISMVPIGVPNDTCILTLQGNMISALYARNFTGLWNLEYLNLSRNQLATIENDSFHDLVRLKVLDLSQNRFVSVPCLEFRKLANLRILDLSRNPITLLSQNCFDYLDELEKLFLSDTKLGNVKAATFRHLGSLNFLDLSRNRLRTLPVGFCRGTHGIVPRIELSGNPWLCDCSMKPLQPCPDIAGKIMCTMPSKLRGLTASISPSLLTCYNVKVRIQPANTVAIVNSSVTITCNVAGAPSVDFRWWQISNNGKLGKSILGKNLNFPNVQFSDTGIYNCEAVDRGRTFSVSEITTLHVVPEVQAASFTQSLTRSTTAVTPSTTAARTTTTTLAKKKNIPAIVETVTTKQAVSGQQEASVYLKGAVSIGVTLLVLIFVATSLICCWKKRQRYAGRILHERYEIGKGKNKDEHNGIHPQNHTKKLKKDDPKPTTNGSSKRRGTAVPNNRSPSKERARRQSKNSTKRVEKNSTKRIDKKMTKVESTKPRKNATVTKPKLSDSRKVKSKMETIEMTPVNPDRARTRSPLLHPRMARRPQHLNLDTGHDTDDSGKGSWEDNVVASGTSIRRQRPTSLKVKRSKVEIRDQEYYV
ncbi:leucine-rich repeat-containing protein 4C-like isoform X2 [Branchiostoma lanceolatum]|uniref:leucine-rich repeat-containing protein 4C-like isoform X2 n=1 Tax=Branchiostoma lanceolatum TaxID=7740 RepID=UPI003456D7CF